MEWKNYANKIPLDFSVMVMMEAVAAWVLLAVMMVVVEVISGGSGDMEGGRGLDWWRGWWVWIAGGDNGSGSLVEMVGLDQGSRSGQSGGDGWEADGGGW